MNKIQEIDRRLQLQEIFKDYDLDNLELLFIEAKLELDRRYIEKKLKEMKENV